MSFRLGGWIGALLVLSVPVLATRAAADCDSSELSLSPDVPRLACEIQSISKAIQAQEQVVPAHLYHYGIRDALLEDIHAGNVPQEAWDKFIMGQSTRYKLHSSRR